MNYINNLFLLSIFVCIPLSGMEQAITDYKKTEHKIINPQLYLSNKRSGGNYPVDTDCHGKYLVSNCTPDNKLVLFCFSGYFEESHWAHDQLVFARNPLSLLNIKTGINKTFRPVTELNNDIPVSAIHMLNNDTLAVGHAKNIYLFKEKWDPYNTLKACVFTLLNPFYAPQYSLETTQTLSTTISDDKDTINTIDSSASHLVAVSSQGHITTWEKNGAVINEKISKTTQCAEEFFSSLFNQKENILYLGLNNGTIFIANIADLTQTKTISLFPESNARINWLNYCDDNLLAATLYHGEYKKNIDSACPECINNKNRERTNKLKKSLINLLDDDKSQTSELSNKFKQFIKKKEEKNDPNNNENQNLCEHHKWIQNPFDIQHSIFSVNQLTKELTDDTHNNHPIQTCLNKGLLKKSTNWKTAAKYKQDKYDYITQIHLLPNNQLLICIKKHEDNFHGSPRELWLSAQNQPESFKSIYNQELHNIHVIPTPTTKEDFTVIKEVKKYYRQNYIQQVAQYTKNDLANWFKNIPSGIKIKLQRLYYARYARLLFISLIPIFTLLESGSIYYNYEQLPFVLPTYMSLLSAVPFLAHLYKCLTMSS